MSANSIGNESADAAMSAGENIRGTGWSFLTKRLTAGASASRVGGSSDSRTRITLKSLPAAEAASAEPTPAKAAPAEAATVPHSSVPAAGDDEDAEDEQGDEEQQEE